MVVCSDPFRGTWKGDVCCYWHSVDRVQSAECSGYTAQLCTFLDYPVQSVLRNFIRIPCLMLLISYCFPCCVYF